MLYSIGNVEDLKDLNELALLQNQVKVVILQDKLGKQNFYEDMKRVIEPVTKSIKDVFGNFIKNIQALENLNNKHLEIMKDSGIILFYLMPPLSKITNPDNSAQFKVLKDNISNRVNNLLKHNSIRITLDDNLLTFRDTVKNSN